MKKNITTDKKNYLKHEEDIEFLGIKMDCLLDDYFNNQVDDYVETKIFISEFSYKSIY